MGAHHASARIMSPVFDRIDHTAAGLGLDVRRRWREKASSRCEGAVTTTVAGDGEQREHVSPPPLARWRIVAPRDRSVSAHRYSGNEDDPAARLSRGTTAFRHPGARGGAGRCCRGPGIHQDRSRPRNSGSPRRWSGHRCRRGIGTHAIGAWAEIGEKRRASRAGAFCKPHPAPSPAQPAVEDSHVPSARPQYRSRPLGLSLPGSAYFASRTRAQVKPRAHGVRAQLIGRFAQEIHSYALFGFGRRYGSSRPGGNRRLDH